MGIQCLYPTTSFLHLEDDLPISTQLPSKGMKFGKGLPPRKRRCSILTPRILGAGPIKYCYSV